MMRSSVIRILKNFFFFAGVSFKAYHPAIYRWNERVSLVRPEFIHPMNEKRKFLLDACGV